MEIAAFVIIALLGHLFVHAMTSVATLLLIFLLTLIPFYVALYRRRYRRSVGILFILFAANVALIAMPPMGMLMWLGALVYAFMPVKPPAHRMIPVESRRTRA